MTNPQQPELRRSERTKMANDKLNPQREQPTDEKGHTGHVPEDNEPGHHPEHDQDKPGDAPRSG